MHDSYRLILFLMLCSINNLVFGQDYEDSEELDPRISRFQKNERSCEHGWRQGFCRKRSECKISTEKVCRVDQKFDPIICCLDQQGPVSLKASPNPVCGLRSPNIQGTSAQISNTGVKGRRLISHRGKRARKKEGTFGKIVGGDVAQRNSWPWMAGLYARVREGSNDLTYVCGASLISQRYVLTAAHCFKTKDENSLRTDPAIFFVVVGAQTMQDGNSFSVKQIQIHPSYNLLLHYHDIALVAFKRPVRLSNKVFPVCLPSDGMRGEIEKDNLNVTVTGWGRTSHGGNTSQQLREITVPTIPLKACNTSLGITPKRPQGIIRQQICAGLQEGGKDACQGDSGGPLVTKLKDNSYVQLGIVSFGDKCGQPGTPGVYTKVSEYIKWIHDNTDIGK